MKKILALFLITLMLLSFVSCNTKTSSDSDDETSSSQSESDNNSENDDNSESDDNSENDENNEISFTGVVAVDNDECTIKITEIDPDNMWGYTLKAELENKSVDKTYMFSVDSASINGVQCDPFFATEVASGKKANESISFTLDDFEEIGDFTDIELTFCVYDSNDWDAEYVAKETLHIYPYGEDKAVQFVRSPGASDNVIVDNEYVTVIVTGYEEDEICGYTVKLFLLNKSDKNIMISAEEVSVNGYMADPFYAEYVAAGKCAFGSMAWLDSTLEENGITDIEEIEFKLLAYNYNDWASDHLANETITLNP